MYKNIVLAYDGSDSAEAALYHARDIAKICGAKIFVVNAYQTIPKLEGDEWVHTVIAASSARGEKLISIAIEQLQEAGIDVEGEVLEGPPANAVLQVAKTRKADLIVMGNRGYNAFTRVFLGSVSLRVLTHSSIPVLIIKAPSQ